VPPTPVPPDVDAFLARPNPAVVASIRRDGSPHSTATWYDWEDGRVLMSIDDERLRLRFMRRDPRVALTVLGVDDWYEQVTLLGPIVSMGPDPGLRDADRLSVRYTGEPWSIRHRPRTTVWVEPDRWHGWPFSVNLDQYQ